MCRLFSLLCLTLLSGPLYSQHFLPILDQYNADDRFRWRGFETYQDDVLKRFIDFCEKEQVMVSERNAVKAMSSSTRRSFSQYIYMVDLNNDALPDIIYNGPQSGEGGRINIFMQEGNTFKRVYTGMQNIIRVEWKDESLSRMYISNPGCCADPNLVRSVYDVEYDERNQPIFKKVYQTVELEYDLVKPKSYLREPVKFEVVNDGYRLRYAPEINDSTMHPLFEKMGNTLVRLPAGSRGTAYGSRTDSTGRIWWYVAIEPLKGLESIVNLNHEFPTHAIGWLSSRYVKEIED